MRPLIENIDDIPTMPYALFEKDLKKYPSFATIMGSRGCPYSCTFCSSRSISGRKYRFHSIERILAELKLLIRDYKQNFVYFMDDNIAANKKHFLSLCDGIIDEGLHKEASFCGSLRGDNATDDILKKAKEAGFTIVYFGLETGVERLMNIINKGESVKDVVDAIKRAHHHGLKVGTTIIFGLPTETRKDRWDTIKLVNSLPVDDVRFNTLAPYPGTPAYADLFPQGKILIKENWQNFGVQYMWESNDIPYVPEESNRLELIWDTMWANMSRYIRIKVLLDLFVSPVTGGKVITLKHKWYLSPKELYKVSHLFFFLLSRFGQVTLQVQLKKISRSVTD